MTKQQESNQVEIAEEKVEMSNMENVENHEEEEQKDSSTESTNEVKENKSKKVPLLERLVKRIYEEDGERKEDFKKVSEIISDDIKDGDVWETRDGKMVISHTGIRKLADFVGAEWIDERLDDTPNSNNDKGFYFHMVCLFPDGTKGKEVGSANDKNSKGDISNSVKYEMAYKRAQDRSFLNSSYMKMYDVYSADEADVWSKEETLLHQLEQKNKQIKNVVDHGKRQLAKLEQEVVRRNRLIDALLQYVSLPETDEKYPNTYIQSILDKEDYDYVNELINNTDKHVGFAAKRLLQLHSVTLEEEQQMDEQKDVGEITDNPVMEEMGDDGETPLSETEHKEIIVEKTEDVSDNMVSDAEQTPIKTEVENTTEVEPEGNRQEDAEVKVPKTTIVDKKRNNRQSKPFTMEPIEQEEDNYIQVDFRLDEEE